MEKDLSSLRQICIISPTRAPGPALVAMTRQLLELPFGAMIIVDDSAEGERDTAILAELPTDTRLHLLSHGGNFGKGRAVKDALSHLINEEPSMQGFVIADADGQHLVDDITNVALHLSAAWERAVFGCRSFGGHAPARSLFGNRVMSLLCFLRTGVWLRDTQCGLRAFPSIMAPELMSIAGERYEYEMNVLLRLCRTKRQPLEVAIQTVYRDGNRGSHFHPLWDSALVCRTLVHAAADHPAKESHFFRRLSVKGDDRKDESGAPCQSQRW